MNNNQDVKSVHRPITRSINSTAWTCKSCKSILGFLDANKETLRIKYKDLFIYIKGGSVQIICRSCGQMNELKEE